MLSYRAPVVVWKLSSSNNGTNWLKKPSLGMRSRQLAPLQIRGTESEVSPLSFAWTTGQEKSFRRPTCH